MSVRTPRCPPEVVPDAVVRDPWLEKIEWLMDRAIPVGGRSFGLDPILGLIPGAGEAIGGMVSLFLVARAVQLGAPKSAIARMLVNVGIDSIVTSVPVLGTIFDFAFKANTRNLRLLQESVAGRRDTKRDITFVVGVVVIAALLVLAPIVLFLWGVSALFGWF
ncbi:MAG: DUF4112 domain-containing protein [Bryobacteraceae bacterium]|nr:DUF4112 domain-containing protein [Bryobacteraceae bacterium]